MQKALFLVPLLMIAGCGNAVSDTIDAVRESSYSLEDGKPIPTSPATVESFTGLAAMGPDHVVFKTGDKFSIVASGNSKAIEALRYKVEDGRLLISRKKDSWTWSEGEPATITVTSPSLASVSLAGSGNITADKMGGDEVKLSVAGSGNLKVDDLQAKKLKAKIAGSGDFSLAGKADSADYSIAGSGDLDAGKLVTTDAEVAIAGSGDATVNATGKVKAKIAGSGDIHVNGGASCTSNTVGSGKVHCG